MEKNLWPVKIAWGGVLATGRATGGTPTTLIDATKNFEVNALRGKYIKILINGVEYVREITANTANTFTFADLVAAVAATAAIEKTGGGKVTITAVPEGSYANDYQVVVQQGEGASAETTAAFEDGVLTITLGTDAGTAASATIGEAGQGQITITYKEVGDKGGGVYTAAHVGLNKDVTVVWSEESLAIGLGTDENGDPDNTKNTAELIAAKINSDLGEIFTATVANAGVMEVDGAVFSGGADPVIDATAADVAAEVDALEGFSAVETAAGLLVALENPVQFAGGVDEVKPVDKTEYCIVDGSEKFTNENPGVTDISDRADRELGNVGIDPTKNLVQLSGSFLQQDPETGAKTITSTAAELFAGLAALDGRYKMIVYNEGSNNVYWGKGTITAQTGFPLLPGDSVVFTFNPTEDMPIYFIAEANTVVRVGELA